MGRLRSVVSDGMPDASNLHTARLGGHIEEIAREALAVHVHVPAAELGRDLPEAVLERRLALVEDEAHPEHEQRRNAELEPHVTKIGSLHLFV